MSKQRAGVGCALALSAIAALATACEGSSQSTNAPPLTGLRVHATALFGVDGCGEGEAQIRHYVVTTSTDFELENGSVERRMQAAALFDCFVDATFLDLPMPAELVVPRYTLRVFGYSASNESGVETARSNLGNRDAELDAMLESSATLAASCTAIQRADLVTTATCALDFDRRTGAADAGARSDGGLDAEANDAGEEDANASDANASDAGEDAEANDAGEEDGGT